MKKIILIAEIGWNHMGNLNLAEKMIQASKKSGADYAKFQTWRVKNLKSGPWDKDGRREIYKKAELSEEDYLKILKMCKKYKIKFLTSIFNLKDYYLIKKLNLKTIKIPSPENRNIQLLEFCNKKFSNIFLSTGAAKISENKKIFEIFDKKKKVNLMHCVSSYPCSDNMVNLNRINLLKKITKNIGLSDHTPDILSSILSLDYGISVIEKHFTINNNLPGRDNKFAILPSMMEELSKNIKRFQLMKKSIKEKFSKQETEIRKVYTGRWSL